MVDTSDEWITTRTGIHTRHICGEGETHTQLCLAAARQALEQGYIDPADVGVCLVATFTGDHLNPATACVLQRELGFREDTICFDLNAACSGFVYALHTAQCLLSAAPRKVGLVLGAEVLSRVTDYTDRGTCVLFGDGAAAAVWSGGRRIPPSTRCWAAGATTRSSTPPASTPAPPPTSTWRGRRCSASPWRRCPAASARCWRMRASRRRMWTACVFHQANQRIIDLAERKLGLPPEKCTGNIAHTGNTSAASVPLLLHELVSTGALRSGQRALCVGFGAGLTWAGALLEMK